MWALAFALAFTGPTSSRVGDSPHDTEQVFAAAATGDLEALQRLAGAARSREASELTPLHVAAQHGQRAAAELLLTLGADANATTVHGASPLHLAARGGHGDVLRLLLQRGASRELRSGAASITALHYAASRGALDCLAALVTADTCGLQTAGLPIHRCYSVTVVTVLVTIHGPLHIAVTRATARTPAAHTPRTHRAQAATRHST